MHPLTRILILVSLFQLGCLGNAHEQVPIKSEADLREPVYDGKTPGQHQDSPKNIMNPASGPEEISIPTNLEDGQPAQLDTVESPTAPSFPWLVTSPYTSQGHLTNLSALPLPSRLFALSLTRLSPVGRSYATTPYQQAFNWPTVFENLRSVSASHNLTWTSTVFYVVEFRSKLKSNIDRELLFKLDRESHREATASGGLLKYWFGKVSDDKEGRNLATCESSRSE